MVDYDNVLVVSSDMMEYWCSANIEVEVLNANGNGNDKYRFLMVLHRR